MKKLFLALMAVAAIAMVSCDHHPDDPAASKGVQTDSLKGWDKYILPQR